MIATLSGTIAEKLGDMVILDVNGVGYGLLVPSDDIASLTIGDDKKLYVYEHIRENSHDLYGFSSRDTKVFFEQLLDVSGVGPKMALSILGIGAVAAVRAAIASGDTKFITQAPGVGKRVAERVVIDLKDKVGLVSTANTEALFAGTQMLQDDEAVQALVALGFTANDATVALSGIDNNLSTEDRVRQALKGRT